VDIIFSLKQIKDFIFLMNKKINFIKIFSLQISM